MSADRTKDGALTGYEVLGQLGEGGSAVVYRARHTVTGELVALKIWRGILDDGAWRRFSRERDILEELSGHPNIVRVKASAAPGTEAAWIATELCEESLADRLRRGPVATDRAFDIADDVLCGLEAIHEAGHLHRDLKPQNVLLVGDLPWRQS